MVMVLFDLVYKLVEKLEIQTGNIPKQEFVEEKTKYILEHSIAEYNQRGLFLRDFSMLGVKDSKQVEVQAPQYLTFKVSSNFKKWRLNTHRSLYQVEREIEQSEVTEIVVVMMDGDIKEYTLVDEKRVIWKNPIYVVEWEEDGEDKQKLIYDKKQLEEVILELVEQKSYRVRAFSILNQKYENFQVFGTIYSTDDFISEPTILWGYIDSFFEDEDNEVLW